MCFGTSTLNGLSPGELHTRYAIHIAPVHPSSGIAHGGVGKDLVTVQKSHDAPRRWAKFAWKKQRFDLKLQLRKDI